MASVPPGGVPGEDVRAVLAGAGEQGVQVDDDRTAVLGAVGVVAPALTGPVVRADPGGPGNLGGDRAPQRGDLVQAVLETTVGLPVPRQPSGWRAPHAGARWTTASHVGPAAAPTPSVRAPVVGTGALSGRGEVSGDRQAATASVSAAPTCGCGFGSRRVTAAMTAPTAATTAAPMNAAE